MHRKLIAGLMAFTVVVSGASVRAQLREYLNSPAAAVESAESRTVVERVATQLEALERAEPARYCGTGLLDYISRHRRELTPGARSAIAAALPGALARPTFAAPEFYDSPTAPIRIHFTRTGPDSVRSASSDTAADGLPTYVHVAEESLSRSYKLLLDSLGFAAPLFDDTIGGGTDLYDVYLARPGGLSFVIAFTAAESLYVRIFNGVDSVIVATSFQVVHPTMEPFPQLNNRLDLLRITCAHELFHAMHYSLDAYEKPDWQQAGWWQEGNSTWFEDYVYPNVNDWTNIGPYMAKPWESIMTSNVLSSLHPYGGGSLWSFYLVERFGDDVLRKIWDQCGRLPGDNTLAAHTDSLAQYGTALNAAWTEFTSWCMRTGKRWDDSSFAQGAAWPYVKPYITLLVTPQGVHFTSGSDTLDAVVNPSVPLQAVSTTSAALEGLAFVPIGVIPGVTDRTDSGMTFQLAAIPDSVVSFHYVGLDTTAIFRPVAHGDLVKGDSSLVTGWVGFDTLLVYATAGAYFVPYAGGTKIATVIPTLMVANDTARPVTPVDSFYLAAPFPNPANLSRGEYVEFGVSIDSALVDVDIRLDIFSMAGDLVRTITTSGRLWPINRLIWDGRNDSGNLVASGMYLCRLKVGSTEEVYRVGIVR